MTTDFNLFDIIRIRLVNPDQKHIDFITDLTGMLLLFIFLTLFPSIHLAVK